MDLILNAWESYRLKDTLKKRRSRDVKFDGAFEGRLLALACSEAPQGHRRWTVRLLADKAVELEFAKSVSHMTVQRILQKTKLRITEPNISNSNRKGTRRL